MKSDIRGITLISLVVTIIILLILAGVVINLTIGENGIIKIAKFAEEEYQNVANYENKQILDFSNEADNIINGLSGDNKEQKEWSDVYTINQKNNYIDKSGKTATIPAGFQVSLKSGETEIEDGLVIRNAEDKNEFVWVPCTEDGTNRTIKYDRYAFSRTNWTYTQTKGGLDTKTNSYKITRADIGTSYYWSETMPTIGDKTELGSIAEYGGFYIGRYEAGTVLERDSNSGTTDIVLIQKEKAVYNYISYSDAKAKAEGLYTNNLTSKLTSSYAWDTTLKFIETKYPEYPTNSIGGNYGEDIATTGYDTVHPCNIYDMGGNVWEFTTENYNVTNRYTTRGGCYYGESVSATTHPAAARANSGGTIGETSGFRITLFL